MTEDDSPENLRKFLENEDPALVQMGLSMAESLGVVSEEMFGEIIWMYMMHDDKTIRAAAKSTFMKIAPEDIKQFIKNNWKASYRTLKGERFTEAVSSLASHMSLYKHNNVLSILVKPVIMEANIIPYNYEMAKRKNSAVKALEYFGDIAVESLITILEDKEMLQLYLNGYDKSRDGNWMGHEEWNDWVWENLSIANVIAAGTLGEIGDKRAVEPLIKALEDSDETIRSAAVRALKQLGHEVK